MYIMTMIPQVPSLLCPSNCSAEQFKRLKFDHVSMFIQYNNI